MGFSSSRPLPFVALFMKPHVSWLIRSRPQMKTAAASERPRNSSSLEPALNRRTSAAALRGTHTDAAVPTDADLSQFQACLPVHALSAPWVAHHEILADPLRRTRDASASALNLTFSCLKGRPQELPVYSPPSKSGRLRRVFSIAAARRHFSTSAWFPPIRTSGTVQPRYSAGRV